MKKNSYQKDISPPALLNLIPNLTIVLQSNGSIVEVNQLACDLLRMSEAELLASSLDKLCAPDELTSVRRMVQQCFEDEKIYSTQARLRTGDGEMIDVDLSLSCYVKDRTSDERYCVAIGRDISEEKQRELDLLRFSNIAHYTVNPLEITDVAGKIIYVNPAFERASGYGKEELLGKNPKIFGSGKHPKIFWDRMWKTITSGKVWTGEIENKRRNGEPFFTQLLISPIIDGGGSIVGYFGVHRDVTEQKQLEQQLIHAQKMESIGLLAAGIAHEVGNPLTSISSVVQVIQRTTQDEFTKEKLELIKSQVTRISRIIRDLVNFSRRSSYEIQLTDVNERLHGAVEIVRVGKKAKEVAFNVEMSKTIPRLPLVPDQIEQVFINILINAVDAIHTNSSLMPSARREITVKSLIRSEDVVVIIHDTGGGISEEHIPKIFEPFFTTKKVGEGTGLGLWVSYGIVKSFQGNIDVESIIGEGTTFTISLPLHSELQ